MMDELERERKSVMRERRAYLRARAGRRAAGHAGSGDKAH